MRLLLTIAGLAAAGSFVAAAGALPAEPVPVEPGRAVHAVGPPPAHTGGFGEPTCQICHEGDEINAYGGSIRLEGLPASYVPGRRYALTVILEAEQTSRAGFQLSARFARGAGTGRPAGALAGTSPGVTTTSGENGVLYIHQAEAGSLPASSDGMSWSLEWTAPRSGEPVVFHVAGNSANGDNSPLLDLVYTAEAVVEGATR